MKKLKALHRFVRPSHLTLTLAVLMAAQVSMVLADRAGRAADAIWVHDEIYSTIGTDTAFTSPPPQSTDIIFSFAGGGLEGQRSVAQYAPGDTDYSGGRWNVMAVSYTDLGIEMLDADADGVVDYELTNAEAVLDYAEMGLLTITAPGVYFECPLLPRNGR